MVERNAQPAWLRLAGLGFELAASIAGGGLLGWWLDGRFGTAPRWLLTGLGIGIVGGLYNLIRAALAASRDAARVGREVEERADRAADAGRDEPGPPGPPER